MLINILFSYRIKLPFSLIVAVSLTDFTKLFLLFCCYRAKWWPPCPCTWETLAGRERIGDVSYQIEQTENRTPEP